MVLEFVKSQRGKPKVKHEGYLYCLLRKKDGLKTWRCKKRQCKAIATTFEEIMGFDQVCSASESFPQIKCCLEYFEETWLGSPGRLGKRSKPLFSITLRNQFENAQNGNQKTNNNVEGWHRAFQLGMGFAHPTITKFLQYLRKEQSFTENRIARRRTGETLPVNAKVERHRQRLQQLLNHYQNNNLLFVLEGLSFNFDF